MGRLFRRWPWTPWCGKSSKDGCRRPGLAPPFANWSSTITKNYLAAEPSMSAPGMQRRTTLRSTAACWARPGRTCRPKSVTCMSLTTLHRPRAARACNAGPACSRDWRRPSSVFPKRQPIRRSAVRFNAVGEAEIWTRTFGNKSFSSRQFGGRGRSERLLCERFGPLTFAMALVPEEGRLRLVLRRWSAFGVPLPMWLGPRSDSYESAEDGRFHFHVEISHPLAGLIVRYRGWLVRTR